MIRCPYCKKYFRKVRSLNAHIAQVHKGKPIVKGTTLINGKIAYILEEGKTNAKENTKQNEIILKSLDKCYKTFVKLCMAFDDMYNSLPKDVNRYVVITGFTANNALNILSKYGIKLQDTRELFNFLLSLKDKYKKLLIRLGIYIVKYSDSAIKIKVFKQF
jgi:hypothetical protein